MIGVPYGLIHSVYMHINEAKWNEYITVYVYGKMHTTNKHKVIFNHFNYKKEKNYFTKRTYLLSPFTVMSAYS